MSKASDPEIVPSKDSDYTCITFQPDLKKFGMKKFDKDLLDLMYKRVFDLAGVVGGSVKVFLNKNRVPI